jgi:ATP-binding cassette subfamily B protein
VNLRLRKFLSYYRPYRRLLIADLVCAFIVSAITLLLPLSANLITKDILGANVPDPLPQILGVGAIMLVLVVLYMICNTFVDYQGHMMGTLMERDMRNELFAHYQTLSFRFYDEWRTGQLMSRITHDLFALSEFYHHGPEDLAIAIIKAIGVFILLMTINVPLTIIIFLFLPIMAAYAFYFNRRLNAALAQSRERIGDINAQVEDALSGVRVVKSFTNEAQEQAAFAYRNERFVASRRDGYRSEAYFYGGMGAFTQLITIFVIVFGSIAILNQALELADLLTYLLCVGVLIDPIDRLVNFARLYQEGITGFNRFMDMLEIQPEITDAPNAIPLQNVRGEVVFDAVSFKYRDDQPLVLENLSLTIRAGEYVALVGASGVGKTTLCALIPRFYEVTTGAIRIDGIDIRDVTQASLRRQIGIVQQDVYLFAGTVAENIGYGCPNATREAITTAAKAANAHDFIMALPNGYDTDVGQRGVKLSGGQKQRLSIARTFLKDPAIIIFDEATSALDNESERAIRESLEALTRDRTTLVIAHRLSTVRNAQRILVLTDDGVAEAGTHESLIAQGGAYARLYALQLTL